jgi:hypothetical protein
MFSACAGRKSLSSRFGTGRRDHTGTSLNSTLTEELAKLWPLLLPWFRRRLSKENAPRLGLAIGLGFGVGEVWLVASLLAPDPKFAGVPWYLFGTLNGYMTERFMVCIHHGAFTAAALRVIRWTPGRGILYAMGLHFLGNLPLALAGWNFGGLGERAWAVIVPVWLVLFFFAMIALLIRFFKAADPEGWRGLHHYLLGQAKCPGCGLVYLRPWFAVNMGTRRYEQCPGCQKWHVTTRWKEGITANVPLSRRQSLGDSRGWQAEPAVAAEEGGTNGS